MIELLELCGFTHQEIESEINRVEKTFTRLDITPKDIALAKQRLRQYYDMDLMGVRLGLKSNIMELVDLMLARDEGKTKILYGFMTSSRFETISTALVANYGEVYSARIDFMLQRVLGCIFCKIEPVFEAAERKWVKAGKVAHCGNVKSIVGLYALEMLPRPDLMVTSGFLCETAPKTIDLLQELYDIPGYCYDTCDDLEFSEPPEAVRRSIDFQVKGLKKFVERVREITGLEVTDDMLREVLDLKGRMGGARRKIGELIQNSDPTPISPHSEMISSPLPLKMKNMEQAIRAADTLYEELRERVEKGIGVVEKGSPRVLATHGPNSTDPRLEQLVTDLGISIVGSAMGTPMNSTGDNKDPYLEMAQMPSASPGLPGRIDAIIEACKRLKVDGLLDLVHIGCRTFAGDALLIKAAVEKKLGLPVLLLEWENFDPRVYNQEEYKWQLEAFKAMMMERKQQNRICLKQCG